MEPIIKVDNVSMCFNLSKEKHESLKEYFLAMVQGRLQYDEFYALKDVSLDIMPGDFYGLVGLNGSGKSTLLKTIAGVYKPSKGKVTVNGTIAPLIELGAGFDGNLTGRENIYLNGAILGMKRQEIDACIDQIIAFSECEEFIDTPVKRYSSGMYVKLAFAVAAHLNSELLLMDEVLAVGDMHFQKKCLDKMQELSSKEGRTVLCVSHNMVTISKFCKRCIVLDKGSVIFDGDTGEAIQEYFGEKKSTETFIDFSNNRRFLWLQRDEVRLLTAEDVNKNDAVFWEGEKIRQHFKWKYNKNVVNLCLRVEVFDSVENPVCAAFIYDIDSRDAGEQGEITVDMDISLLREGKYKTIYTLFVRDTNNESVDLDCVNGLEFEKKIITQSEIVWHSKSWGSIELPQLEMVEVQ